MTKTELRQWRKSAGLTQARAAELIGCSRRALQKWEAGQTRIPKSIALAIAATSKKLKPFGTGRR